VQPMAARVLSTAEGTQQHHDFGPVEWGLFAVPPLIWGCSFLLIAIGLDDFSPAVVTMLRISFGALTLATIPAARRSLPRHTWIRLAVVAATWMAIPFSFFSLAEQWIDSSLAGMLNGAMPLMTAGIAALLLRRLPGPVQIAGLTIGFAGVVAVMWPALRDGSSSSATGVLLVLLAVLCYGFAANVSVPLQQQYGTLPVIFHSQLFALLMTAPFGLAGIGRSSFGWSSLAAVVALGALGTGVAFVAMGALLVRVGAARASVAVYFVPIVAVVAGVVFRDEHIAALSLAGMVVVVVGAVLTSRADRRRDHRRASAPVPRASRDRATAGRHDNPAPLGPGR
jgi:drug/metabolite transporter (DMT)-like permease